MAKLGWKGPVLARLKIAGFILALVGWFLVVTVILEKVCRQDLSALEGLIRTGAVKWGIKIFVIVLLVLLIKGQTGINHVLDRYRALRITIRTIFIGGVIGWVLGLGSLILK